MADFGTDGLLRQISELTAELAATKKYGLVWERERNQEETVLLCKTKIPVLKHVVEKDVINGGLSNCIIEGDNFHALVALNYILKEGFDGIYIDPPYNTGAEDDFRYNDRIVDKNDVYRHSKWLNFMSKRLILARELLKDTGVIFISIGDDEFGNLRLLCDKVFGENTFLGDIVWQSNTQPVNAGRAKFGLQKTCDHTFVYCKRKSCLPDFILDSVEKRKQYPFQDERGFFRTEIIEKRHAGRDKRSSMQFEILGMKPREGKRWQIGEETARQLEAEGRVIIQDGTVKKKIYKAEEATSVSYKPFWALLLAEDVGSAQTGKAQLNEVLGFDAGFETVKSIGLIKSLIGHLNPNGYYLDFFAGSGTTGQAILDLNADDGGTRRFVLCQNNENSICEDVLYPRLKTVVTGSRSDGSYFCDGHCASLRYFTTDYIDDETNSEQAKYNLVEKVDSLLCLLEGVFDQVERNDYSSHYYSGETHLFIFNDYFNEEHFAEFKRRVLSAGGSKIVYMYSSDNTVDETLFGDPSVTLKPIPSKIYEIYKEIVEDIKRGE